MMTPFQRMLSYVRRYPLKVISGSLCVVFSAYIGLLGPRVIRMAVDGLRSGVTQDKVTVFALLIVAVSFGKGIFLFSQRKILVGLSRDIEFDIRNDFYAQLQRMSLDFYHNNRTGDLMSRATNDISNVRMLLGPAIMYGLNTIFTTMFAFPAMLLISGKLTLVSLATLPLSSFATKYFGSRIHKRSEEIQEYFGVITAKAQENMSGVRVVRAYAQEEAEEASFKALNREFVNRNLRLIRLSALFMPTLQVLIGFGPALVLWYGGNLVLNGTITLGQFVEFNLYLALLIWPMIALGYVVNLFQRGMAGMKRLNEILVQTPAIRDTEEKQEIKEIQGSIEFRDLTFAYPGAPDHPVLENLNLVIPCGKTIALIGHTGAGKSTFINLIPRLLDAPPGQVLIDGRPIREIPLQVLRQNIGYVPQETFLFSDSVAGNIAFGVPQAAQSAIEEVSEQSALLEDIQGFPEGFETMVGERGITLSGGQKQRSSLARAILRNPRILILDDALSAVDTYTEEKILGHLRSIMRGRTTILVAHRISTVKEADEIIVLHNGRIAERGTHDELLKNNGPYLALYEKQLLEEELAAL
ncbi:MAG: ABC transporter ATP-binding protein/permease [Blastocatellia bacterium]|nr:ABC transporter ATP-binding protein/permease [Blastocatellia bacterium]